MGGATEKQIFQFRGRTDGCGLIYFRIANAAIINGWQPMNQKMSWEVNREAWIDGFRTGVEKRLGSAPKDMPKQSWLAGYLEGVDPAEQYNIAEGDGIYRVERFDPREGEPYEVEEGQFESRDQAEQFLEILRCAMARG